MPPSNRKVTPANQRSCAAVHVFSSEALYESPVAAADLRGFVPHWILFFFCRKFDSFLMADLFPTETRDLGRGAIQSKEKKNIEKENVSRAFLVVVDVDVFSFSFFFFFFVPRRLDAIR